jgi:ferredoxin
MAVVAAGSTDTEDVIEALQGLGASPTRVMFAHILPNAASPIIVRATIGMGFTILLAAGLEAPYSCREGSCSACTCLVLEGEVKLLRNTVLSREDLEDGYVLACQAVPLTDDVRVTYE